MDRKSRLGIVLGGCVAAGLFAYAAMALHRASAAPDSSDGMQAAGEMLTFVGVFFVAAIVPTAFALHSVRGKRGLWTAFAGSALAVALTGPVALALDGPSMLAMLAPLRLLAAPLLAGAFLVFAMIAPAGRSRRMLLLAWAVEAVVAVAAVFIFFWP